MITTNATLTADDRQRDQARERPRPDVHASGGNFNEMRLLRGLRRADASTPEETADD